MKVCFKKWGGKGLRFLKSELKISCQWLRPKHKSWTYILFHSQMFMLVNDYKELTFHLWSRNSSFYITNIYGVQSPLFIHIISDDSSCVLSHFSHVLLFAIAWTGTWRTGAHQALLSMGFSRQEHWSGLPFPSPGDLPDPRIKPMSLTSPALADGLFTPSTTWEALILQLKQLIQRSWQTVSESHRNKPTLEMKTNSILNNRHEADQTTTWPVSRGLSELTMLFLLVACNPFPPSVKVL